MAQPNKVSGIDVSEDMQFQRAEWKAQRAGWFIMAMLLLAGLLGLFGKGPLGEGEAGDPNGPLSAKFDRLDRYQAPGELVVHAAADAASGDELRLTLNRDYLERLEIEKISPEPDSVEASGDKLVYVFKVADPSQSSDVTFQYRFTQFGSASARLGIEGGPDITFNQFVYP